MAATPLQDAPSLRLHALDSEDLALLSAHLQDALVRVGDIAFMPGKRRFALVGSRFDWAAEMEGRLERCRAGLHFEGVQRVRCQKVSRDQPDAILDLLAVTFEPAGEPPGGTIRLTFAGGAAICLDVECVEAMLTDLGPRWKTAARPKHDLSHADPGYSSS
ncbi:DUF2948 family protein [Methylocystis parvus]|uniref:DUF2948 family protein n=1 Tax=Methylocystis parvus TaxID=134 RepID=A0A6B8M7V8_9HYPH|nr:DUF2948 family protein [Methylocystis parvus]QGM98485.1 DUF2948 family protein [Methylocystis parvus]WBK01178.1 DUF2948 family protein [Methylocystis parvus OBBP]